MTRSSAPSSALPPRSVKLASTIESSSLSPNSCQLEMNDFRYPYDGVDTLYSLDLTYHNDKVSCVRWMYYVHMMFAYLVVIVGLAAMLTRIIPGTKWLHKPFGRLYIILMLWAMASSLVIHNEGLPPAVLVSFLWVLGGLTLGWLVITSCKSTGDHEGVNLKNLSAKAGISSGSTSRSFRERFFSVKSLHGLAMFTSWFNIAGRAFAPGGGNFTCRTYAIYKPVNSPVFDGEGKNLTTLPMHDPNFSALPFSMGLAQWACLFLFAPIVAGLGVGACCSYHYRDTASTKAFQNDSDSELEQSTAKGLGSIDTISAQPNAPLERL